MNEPEPMAGVAGATATMVRAGIDPAAMATTPATVPAPQVPESPASARARALFDAIAHNGTMAEMVGWRFVDFDDATTTLRLGFVAGKLFCNPMGMVHGGFIATMLDETMGSTLVATSGGTKIPATISATIDYVRPAMCGDIHAVGRVRHMGGKIAFLEAELHDPAGRLLAKAGGSFKIMDFDPDAFRPGRA